MKPIRGMSFIDVIVGVGMMLVVFLSIFGAYRIAIDLVLNTKARIGGMSLVSQQLEYVRGLPYDSLGTVGGIPSGPIPQVATSSLNNIAYTLNTLIRYVDDPADGTGNADSNTITADYKEIKVEALWSVHTKSYSTFAVTRVAPHGIESLSSGGTLRVNVFDANAAPVQGASVHVTNASTTPPIDLSVETDAGGSIAFPGAPPASKYKIVVTKDQYSTDQTYDATAQNPNPNPGAVSVANKQTTTASFAIDRTGSLNVSTYSPLQTGFFEDDFSNQSKLAATTSTTVSGGDLKLLETGNGYAPQGDARSNAVTPPVLASWDLLTWVASTSARTAASVQVVYLTGGLYVPVPDSVISGNSAGLTSGSVSLSAVSTSTYPSLSLKGLLATTDASSTPTITAWKIDYHAGPSPLPNIGFTVYGQKTIGTSASGAPVYKFLQNLTTSALGSWLITPIEWDTYTLQLSGATYDIGEQCPTPLSVLPAETKSVSLILYPHTAQTLRVAVTGGGSVLPGATVTVTGPGGSAQTSSSCGQAFWSGLAAQTYTVALTAPNYTPTSQNISVSGATVVTVPMVHI